MIQELSNLLLQREIKPSLQRLKILEYLMENKIHPTVDDIYSALQGEIPTLSKTTVYNTLGTFLEAGLVRAVQIEDNELRYDPIIDEHGHFKCKSCGQIYDFQVDTSKLLNEALPGFTIHEKDVFLKGICKKCQSKVEN